MAVTYSSGNYHSIADAAGMSLPNGDWTWVTVIRPGSDITTGQDIISNREWGTANSFNLYIVSSTFAVQIDAGSINVDVSVSANTWIAAMVRRSGGNVSIHSVPMGGSSVTSSGTASMSAASDGLAFHFGRRQDTGANPFLGSMSDAIFIPGVALSTTDLSDIATGTAMDSTGWWSSREFHGIFSTAASELDNTGNHTITKGGTPPFLADPAQLVRFGASEWVASGAGGFSGVGNAAKKSDLSAAGTSGFTANANTLVETELSADGVGAFSGVGNALFKADLSAVGVGEASFDGLSGQTDLNASGIGVASFNVQAVVQSDFNAAGAGGFSFNATATKLIELAATGTGGFSADAKAAKKVDLSADGLGAFAADSHTFINSHLSATGAGAFNADSHVIASSEFIAVGSSVADFQPRIPSEFDMGGIGQATFVAVALAVPVTIPGSNLYIIPENFINSAATLDATSTASGFDVNNVKLDAKSKIHRTTGTSSQTITATWTETKFISAVAMAFTNLIEGSTVQIKLYTNTGDSTPVYDTGSISVDFAYDPPTGFTSVGLNSFAFGGGNYFSKLFATVPAKKLEIITNSAGNPDGYIEISRIICGTAYTPELGAAYGAQISHIDNTSTAITDAGDTLVNRGIVKRSLSFSLGVLDPVSKHGLANVIKNRGASNPMFASMYENSEKPEERQAFMIYGRFDTPPATTISSFNIYNSTVSITEV